VKDGHHNDTWLVGSKEYIYKIKEFMDTAIQKKNERKKNIGPHAGGQVNASTGGQPHKRNNLQALGQQEQI
jgi:hypothetical protein